MKKTEVLQIVGDIRQPESELQIHPNDGFDLGLMTVEYETHIFAGVSLQEFQSGNGEGKPGKIRLLNECPVSTLKLNLGVWEKMGKPPRVRLFYNHGNLLIALPE
jgi:hypothetical protein